MELRPQNPRVRALGGLTTWPASHGPCVPPQEPGALEAEAWPTLLFTSHISQCQLQDPQDTAHGAWLTRPGPSRQLSWPLTLTIPRCWLQAELLGWKCFCLI